MNGKSFKNCLSISIGRVGRNQDEKEEIPLAKKKHSG
jgi:hypothetical protein